MLYGEKRRRYATILTKSALETLAILSLNPDYMITDTGGIISHMNYRDVKYAYQQYKKRIFHMAPTTRQMAIDLLHHLRKWTTDSKPRNMECIMAE